MVEFEEVKAAASKKKASFKQYAQGHEIVAWLNKQMTRLFLAPNWPDDPKMFVIDGLTADHPTLK